MHNTLRSAALPALAALIVACGEEIGPPFDGRSDSVPPVVVALEPVPDATEVPLDAVVRVTFSEPVNPATVAAASFMVFRGLESVGGRLAAAGSTATFVPDDTLEAFTVYRAQLTAAIRDSAGNPLPGDTSWLFVTGDSMPVIIPVRACARVRCGAR